MFVVAAACGGSSDGGSVPVPSTTTEPTGESEPTASPTSTDADADADAGATSGDGGTPDDENSDGQPTPEECGRQWQEAVSEAGELTLTGLAEHIAAYEAAGCDDVCGDFMSPVELGTPCRPTP